MRESSKAKVHPPTPVGDGGVLGDHLDQDGINSGAIKFKDIFAHGKHLFAGKFNRFDGQGRPDQTSSGGATANRPRTEENYLRVSGPDSTSCWQCHNLPRSGGGGDLPRQWTQQSQDRSGSGSTEPESPPEYRPLRRSSRLDLMA